MIQLNLPETKNYIRIFETTCINVTHGSSLNIDESLLMTSIDNIKNNEHLKRLTHEDIRNYFVKLLEDELCVDSINGLDLENISSQYNCDYCNTLIDKNYYYCYHCHKDMCDTCFTLENEQCIKNFGIDRCKEAHLQKIKPRKIRVSDYHYCDVCHKLIIMPYYTKPVQNNYYDVCDDCYTESPDQSLSYKSVYIPCDDCRFGSMIDWVPILTDTEYSLLLVNKNTSEYCIGIYINGKIEYYIVDIIQINQNINEGDTFYSVLTKIKST